MTIQRTFETRDKQALAGVSRKLTEVATLSHSAA
jgi:hypothetical protein